MSRSRRQFLTGVGGCALCASQIAAARVLPTDLEPLIDVNYEPVDADERGMWQSMERVEEMISKSPQLLNAPELRKYTVGVVERLIARPAPDLRIYLMRDAAFNASMFPSGMMIVNTGFMARTRSEAQFAAVLGHEAGHYYRKHSIERYRELRHKSAVAAFVSVGAGAFGATLGGWVQMANGINAVLLMSVLSFSRHHEAEADAYGVTLMARSGYSPQAAAEVWRQLIEERKASAVARKTKYRDRANSVLSTHPPSADRMTDLGDTAAQLTSTGGEAGFEGREEWRAAIAPHLPMLLEEQVGLNDPGASIYLIESLARDGWTGLLRYHEGEIYRLRSGDGDEARAAEAYAAATTLSDAPAEAWRAHGYALIKAGKAPEGREALNHYLSMKPDAKDAGMIRFTLAQ